MRTVTLVGTHQLVICPMTTPPSCTTQLQGTLHQYHYHFQHGIGSFGINGAVVMTAKDSSVTTFGNSELSTLDKEKLQCMYDCDVLLASNCGGHEYGTSGTMSGSCCCGGDWLLRAESGMGITVTFTAFSVIIKY